LFAFDTEMFYQTPCLSELLKIEHKMENPLKMPDCYSKSDLLSTLDFCEQDECFSLCKRRTSLI